MPDKITQFLEEVKYIWISPIWELAKARQDHDLKAVVLQWDNVVEDKHVREVVPFTTINESDLMAYLSFISCKVKISADGLHYA